MAGDGGAGMPPKIEDGGVNWSDYKSLLDVLPPARRWDPTRLPNVRPPIPQYVDEVIQGCRNGPGEATSRPGSKQGSKSSPQFLPSTGTLKSSGASLARYQREPRAETRARRVKGLLELLKSNSDVTAVGIPLFWITVGGVVGKIPSKGLECCRDELAHAWHFMTLRAHNVIPLGIGGDTSDRDWALSFFPILFAQIFYRILVDGFEQDKKHLLLNADTWLDKLMLVAHFELTGFQLLADTARKMRKRMFVKQVLQMPHLNRKEFLKGKKWQELVESRNATVDGLAFGKIEAPGMEAKQLEHIMHGREAVKQEKEKQLNLYAGSKTSESVNALATGEGPSPFDDLPRPPPYRPKEHLSVDNYEDLEGMAAELQDRQLSILNDLFDDDSDDDVSNISKSLEAFSVGMPSMEDDALMDSAPPSPGVHFNLDQSECPSPTSPSAASKMWRKVRHSTFGMPRDSDEHEAEERRQKLRAQKQDALHASIAGEPLAPALCEREMVTSWVSPMTKRLHINAKDRTILNKTREDTFFVKMKTKETDEGATSATLSGPAGIPAANSGGLSGLGRSAKSLPALKEDQFITIEPPKSLSAKVIVKRLDDQADAFRLGTFGEYVKEHDVLTGLKKVRIDASRLAKEERGYLQKMNGLIGGRPAKLLGPRHAFHASI